MARLSAFTILLLFSIVGLACKKREGLREWSPQDHRLGETPTALPSEGRSAPSEAEASAAAQARALWMSRCASCHGAQGRGDGPARPGPMPNLQSVEWQTSHDDQAIAEIITAGKGAMPAFGGELRPEAIQALVTLVRGLHARAP